MAVGLYDGFARDMSDATQDESWDTKFRREAAFPRYLLQAAMTERRIEGGEAGRPDDGNRILNVLAGKTGKAVSAKPPEEHASFVHANELLQGHVALAVLNAALISRADDAHRAIRARTTHALNRAQNFAGG